MVRKQYQDYTSEKTGNTLSQRALPNMSFPAITICSTYFDLGKAWMELGFPANIMGMRPQGLKSNPIMFYDILDRYDLPILPNLWKYYFTLDKVLMFENRDIKAFCLVGNAACSPPRTMEIDSSLDENIVKVEAGEWKSQFLADSQYGVLSMCHTLKPNVTVDFSSIEGRTMGLTWNVPFIRNTPYWKIYVHDKNEHFLPQSYAIETMASLTLQRNHSLKTILIKSSITKKPPPSKKHPCINNYNYSENLCNIKWGWDKKLEIMEEFYGDRFQCQIAGIISGKLPKRPVCNHFDDLENGTLGQLNLTKRDNLHKYSINKNSYLLKVSYLHFCMFRSWPRLGSPAVGSYKQSSPCIPNCSKIKYTLEEQVSLDIADAISYDLTLYFDSPVVEVWEEYRLDSQLDFVSGLGGSIGLVLGASMFTMISYILETLVSAWRRMSRKVKTSPINHSI